jgi:hypothetical protein
MKTIMSHAQFVSYAHKIYGLDLVITRTRVLINDKSVKDQASLVVPADFDVNARTKLRDLDLDVIEDYVSMNRPELISIRSCAKKDLMVKAIIRIRSQTGLGLKEAKDLYEDNKENWKR